MMETSTRVTQVIAPVPAAVDGRSSELHEGRTNCVSPRPGETATGGRIGRTCLAETSGSTA